MSTITLKDIPRSIHMALKHRAQEHGRSLNKEVLACLEMAVAATRIDTDAFLLEIRQHRSTLPGKLTDRLIHEATDLGRP